MHIGMIVGIGPAATDYYYRCLIKAFGFCPQFKRIRSGSTDLFNRTFNLLIIVWTQFRKLKLCAKILLGIGLPRLNGIEAAKSIPRISPKSKIPFLSVDDIIRGLDLDQLTSQNSLGEIRFVT